MNRHEYEQQIDQPVQCPHHDMKHRCVRVEAHDGDHDMRQRYTPTPTDYASRIAALWNDEGCDVEVTFECSRPWADAPPITWNVYLVWRTDRGSEWADYATFRVNFYDEQLEVALRDAVEWLEQLAPWAVCTACGGERVTRQYDQATDTSIVRDCAECDGIGLASHQNEWARDEGGEAY